MTSPRLNQTLSNPLQNEENTEFSQSQQSEAISAETQAIEAASFANHSISTAASGSDHSQLSPEQFEAMIDARMQGALDELSTCSQVRSSAPSARAADSNGHGLPVSSQGNALGDDPVGDLSRKYRRADRIYDFERRVQQKYWLLKEAEFELSSTKWARRKASDLGGNGRLEVAKFAREHGTRRAAEAYCLDPTDPKSVRNMMRNVQRYVIELDKIEKAR